MGLTLITGVPGTGKTAFIVSELEKIAATGRTIFVDNITGLKIPHYRAGAIPAWQTGTWLHIDRYIRTSPSVVPPHKPDLENDELDGNENWEPARDVSKHEDGKLTITAYDGKGVVVGAVPYENHKGALLVIDECQRHFRPRPSGSAVPDFVAALEVHRHQGLDIWLVSQRPGLVDSNVRAICDKHIALRKTPFGRYKYEWSEVGDIDSKLSRDTAAKSRFRLPKHVFSLYKSAEVHNKTTHALPFAAKVLMLVIPLLIFGAWASYKVISGTKHKEESKKEETKSFALDHEKNKLPLPQGADELPNGLTPYVRPLDTAHPYQGAIFSIVSRLQSAKRDLYRFSLSAVGKPSISLSGEQLQGAGYKLTERSDCAVKISYKDFSTYATCGVIESPPSDRPAGLALVSSPSPVHASIN